MPIPELNAEGILPEGLHEATLEEIDEVFGRFQRTSQRMELTKQLKEYVGEVRSANVAKALIIDGSYVTAKEVPSDIDMILVLKDDVDLSKDVPPFIYNARSKRMVQKAYDFDLFPAFEGDRSYEEFVKLFSKAKDLPGRTKGLLKLHL
ncbi:MAG: hypothetical protein IT461_07655 [Planctomycetes bacterium]|nr:hypothetical protein [Planctomycetota bacterium]